MSPLGLVCIVLVFLGIVQNNGRESHKNVPFFMKTLQELHRGPLKLTVLRRANVQEKWITQKLDNFDESNTETYNMRYLLNDEFKKFGSPIFISFGGEWEIEESKVSVGHWYDMAKEHNGVLIYTEHRFYGKSVPTSNVCNENLQYLHVKQALADLANFIKTYKLENAELTNSKVLLAGGSYSATMVVWFKRLYPELIVGGWASSAPLLAKVDFLEYKEVVGKAFRELGSQQCYNRIENGIAELENMFANKRSAEARAMLRLCNDFDEQSDLDIWTLFGGISNLFASIVQYQHGDDIKNLCSSLLSYDDDATAIANFVYWGFGMPSGCIDASYDSTVEFYMDNVCSFGDAGGWYYQNCNEFGWFQTSKSRNQPFGTKFPIALYVELCRDLFGRHLNNEKLKINAAQTNRDFGGMEPSVENIYMTHGSLDPWHKLGHGVNEGATIITNASHCADFESINEYDSAEMRESKERLAEFVRQWLT